MWYNILEKRECDGKNEKMRMEKKQIIFFFVKMVLFIAIFMDLFSAAEKVFLAKDINMYVYNNFVRQPENSIDILIMGSSHSMDGIEAREVDRILTERYGIKSKTFNMSVTGMRLEQIGYRWKEALKTQKPSVLVIETFSLAPQSTGTNEIINRWALDYIPLSIEKVKYIEKKIGEDLRTSFLVPFIKYHSRWGELTEEDWEILSRKKTRVKSQGYGFTASDKPGFEGIADDYFEQDFSAITEKNVLTQAYQEELAEIIESCREINCKILFLCIPYKVQAGVYASELVKYNNYLEQEYVNNEDIYMYDMQKNTEFLQWGYEHMSDEGHVGNLGREVINRELADRIKEIWGE